MAEILILERRNTQAVNVESLIQGLLPVHQFVLAGQGRAGSRRAAHGVITAKPGSAGASPSLLNTQDFYHQLETQ
jgi:hypothetical protein